MSIRRRAIHDRVERARKLNQGFEETKRAVEAIQAMCARKIAAGETQVTVDDLKACFPEPQTALQPDCIRDGNAGD